MEKNKILKRLYVGGLGHTISQNELKERFNKFGDVTDVEIISRKDEQGNKTKTFAYLNISISETELKKCMSILNKTKWKGGTLQIELAKESFLHRLARERQEVKEKKEKPLVDSRPNLMESLKKAGVVDFQLKAVPGTEVPDHKDWVVSKFGRVLPVLNIKGQHRRKFQKYDPSKYCHNISKLNCESSDTIPISQLTWHLEGGDDDISKKRRGEFTSLKSQIKKLRIQSSQENEHSPGIRFESKRHQEQQCKVIQKSKTKLDNPSVSPHIHSQWSEKLLKKKLFPDRCPRFGSSMSDRETDSEEEIKAMVEMENRVQKGIPSTGNEDSNLEVVGDTFELKYNTHWALIDPAKTKRFSKRSKDSIKEDIDDDYEYDSADTDEIIAVKKTPNQSNQKSESPQKPKSVKLRKKDDHQTEASKSMNNIDSVITSLGTTPNKVSDINFRSSGSNKRDTDKTSSLHDTANDDGSESRSSRSGTDLEDESSNSEGDADYEALMQNCYHLDLTLSDLERLATESSSEESRKGKANSETLCEPSSKIKKMKNGGAIAEKSARNDEPTKPEDILSSILEEESTDDEHDLKKKKPHMKFPTFKGLGALLEKKSSESSMNADPMCSSSSDSCNREVVSSELPSKVSDSFVEATTHRLCFSEDNGLKNVQAVSKKVQKITNTVSSSLKEIKPDPSSSVDENAALRPAAVGKIKSLRCVTKSDKNNCKNGESSTKCGMEEDSSDSGTEDQSDGTSISKLSTKKGNSNAQNLVPVTSWQNTRAESRSVLLHGVPPIKDPLEKESKSPIPDNSKQVLDNQKRLAALQERERERNMQKQLIQGALSNLDHQSASKSCHIVFESDSETEDRVEEKSIEGELVSRETPETKEFASKRTGKLFDDSEDEDDASDADDIERFKIKTQFEGKAGEKLMHLQSRFGTDDRFRMDSRFLESDSKDNNTEERKDDITAEEEQLAAEKKKNLEILQSLMHVKQTTKAKKFKDINALQYDPTKEDHAAFETKVETTPKESKAKRKKKREEAEKLPEVSKEIYHSIAINFKEVFGSAKHTSEESNVVMPWDKADNEPDGTDASLSAEHGLQLLTECDKTEETSAFTFSFFGDDIGKPATKEEVYKIETIKPAKMAWQEDMRFKDSSSEDDEEMEIAENKETSTSALPEPEKNAAKFFFFSRNDERLKVGPKLFCRSSNLDDEREAWEERCALLLEECRKRHKDAKRKVKAKQ